MEAYHIPPPQQTGCSKGVHGRAAWAAVFRNNPQMRALLVKMSSLGDVVHALPAVTAAGRRGVRFDWVVEEAYQPVVERHPAVDRAIPIAWRRWRKALWEFGGEMRAFHNALTASKYDLVLDSQGLMKSAVVAGLARGSEKVGFAKGDVRESQAAWVYGRGIAVPPAQHAIDRQRQLFAAAFGYAEDAPPVDDFGLAIGSGQGCAGNPCVFLHGSAWPSKLWPEAMWIALVRRAMAAGLEPLLPWGNEAERSRARRIAEQGGGRVLDALELDGWVALLQRARLVVGVDSGLTQLAAALGAPTLALHGSTSAELTGCRGRRSRVLASAFGCAPCQSRACRYRGPGRTWRNRPVMPPCYAELAPARVWAAALELMDAAGVLHI